MAVIISSTVQAVNDLQKEKQFRQLNDFANSKKLVHTYLNNLIFKVSIWRDGELKDLHQSELVTGDIIMLNGGMEVPADILVLEAHEMSTDESAMTGETDPVNKRIYKECVAKRELIKSEGGAPSAGHHDVYSPILLSGTKVSKLPV